MVTIRWFRVVRHLRLSWQWPINPKQAGAKLNTRTTPNYGLASRIPQDAQKFGPDAGRTIVKGGCSAKRYRAICDQNGFTLPPPESTRLLRMVQEGCRMVQSGSTAVCDGVDQAAHSKHL